MKGGPCTARAAVRFLLSSAPLLVPASAALAQEEGWHTTVEASANLLFGAAQGRVVSGTVGTAHVDSTLELHGDVNVTYADSRDSDGRRRVTARSWRTTAGADYLPEGRWSPFWFGSAESNYQQRIARRYGSGAGAKLTLRRWEKDDDLSVSLAALWERTRALHPDSATAPVATRVRWSLRFRFRKQLGPNVHFSHVTFYQPAVNALGRYTADVTTALEVNVTSAVAMTVTLRDRYDSEALRRGASSNSDGQFLFGVKAAF